LKKGKAMKKSRKQKEKVRPLASVISFAAIKAHQANPDVPLERLLCPTCGHGVALESEWFVALDCPAIPSCPEGSTSSGRYCCPVCEEYTGFTQLDQYVKVDRDYIHAKIPLNLAQELVSSLDREQIQATNRNSGNRKTVARYSLGNGILNAVQKQLMFLAPEIASELTETWPAKAVAQRKKTPRRKR
jgi:hypothetical protein